MIPNRPAIRRIITQLIAMRMTRGWTQRHVADAIGVHTDYLQVLESGRKAVRAATLDAWAGLFDAELTLGPRTAQAARAVADGQAVIVTSPHVLAEQMRAARTEAGRSQFDVDAALGWARGRTGWLERCDADPSLRQVLAWADENGFHVALVRRSKNETEERA